MNTTRFTLGSSLFACLILGTAAPLLSADPASPVAAPTQQPATVQTGEAGNPRNSCYQTQPEGQGAIDAKDWVQQAQAIILKHGTGATPDYSKVQCYRGAYYTVVYKMDGTCVLQSKSPKDGSNTNEVGMNAIELADTEGKKYVKEMIETAKTSGEGWIDYLWPDPDMKKTWTRCIYFQRVRGQDALVGCSFIKIPRTPVLKVRPKLASTQPQQGDAGKSRLFVPDLNLIMHWCPPGSFTMGSNNLPATFLDGPPHQVTLTHGFWIAETEVTQAQWEAVMGNNPTPTTIRGDGIDAIRLSKLCFKGPDLPIVEMTKDECVEFCKKLTEREHQAGRLPADATYTLPTEAQWVYAAQAGSTSHFTGDLDTIAWYKINANSMTHPVAQKLPNAWGLYDMYGNAWEFCSDKYSNFTAEATTDPVGPSSSDGDIIRGGGWDAPYKACITAIRKKWPLGSRRFYVGFRIVCTAGLK